MAVPVAGGIGRPALLELLADGQLHSGESLAAALGLTRAAVWKGVERLRALGIEVQARASRGYRLAAPVELLEPDRVLAELSGRARTSLRRFELLFEVDSTNTRLLQVPAPPPGQADVCLSELQHGGRGRLGRRWVAPFGSGIALSLAWSFSDAARHLPALSLSVGVAAVRALRRLGAGGVGLKWPNDLWYRDRKVGGVLIEIRAEAGGPAHVVIGAGLNVCLPAAARAELRAAGAEVAAVDEACPAAPSRNLVAGALLDELLSMLSQYEMMGFAALREEWCALDALGGREVRLVRGSECTTGIARGVDAGGALLLEVGGATQRFVSGETSLRLSAGVN